MPLKQVIKDEQGNFVQLANVSGTNNASSENVDLSEINSKIEAVEETANNALPKTGGEMTGDLVIQSNEIDRHEIPEENLYAYGLYLTDKNKLNLGGFAVTRHGASGDMSVHMSAYNNVGENNVYKQENMKLVLCKDGIAYATSPHPRANNYGTDIVTTQALKNYSLQKIYNVKNIYIGGDNSSDTADINFGRGETIDLPFETLTTAVKWSANKFSGNALLRMNILGDTTLNLDTFRLPQIPYIEFYSANNSVVTFLKTLSLQSGCIYINGIHIYSEIPNNLVSADGITGYSSIVFYGGTTDISGTVNTVLNATRRGQIFVINSITGSVTGKKYSCTEGSCIYVKNNNIPGTIAGTKDDSSIVL